VEPFQRGRGVLEHVARAPRLGRRADLVLGFPHAAVEHLLNHVAEGGLGRRLLVLRAEPLKK